MKKYIDKSLTVIIRTVGERTTALCHELLKKQISDNNIHIIFEIPFTKAVRKTFEIGMNDNRKWTFVVDADVLVKPGIIDEIIEYGEATCRNVFKIEGKVIDKFLDSPREAGTHLYRTRLMDHALELVPPSNMSIRPETHVRNAMNKKGYPYIKTEIMTGLHDFEQYYRDIYRKCFVQSKKHHNRVLNIIKEWEKRASHDADFMVALAGFNAGSKYEGNVEIDSNAYALHNFDEVLSSLAINEKTTLDASELYDDDAYFKFSKNFINNEAILKKQKDLNDNPSVECIIEKKRNRSKPIDRFFKRIKNQIYEK